MVRTQNISEHQKNYEYWKSQEKSLERQTEVVAKNIQRLSDCRAGQLTLQYEAVVIPLFPDKPVEAA